MIQMCVYNSILAGRLEDCWLAPGKAATAGCTRRLLAGPWETAGWPLGRLLLLAALGGCWLAPGKVDWPLGRLLGMLNLLIFTEFADFGWVNAPDTEWIRFMANSQFGSVYDLKSVLLECF